jgi:LacI family transcriptional regulator
MEAARTSLADEFNDKKRTSKARGGKNKRVTLKDLGKELDLSPGTISVVLNNTAAAEAIPESTQERIRAAARARGYSPNLTARSLRDQRSFSVGVLVPEVIEGYAAAVLGGVQAHLVERGYLMLVASPSPERQRLEMYLDAFRGRQVDGLISVNSPLFESPDLPTVTVAGREDLPGVTNVVIDHRDAAQQALSHLVELGHRRIAFFRGHPGSADTADRWEAILAAAADLQIQIVPRLTVQLSGDEAGVTPEKGYQEGYAFGRKLIDTGEHFTALFAFNDISAIGAMRAFLDAGLSVPEQISVVGFDDIQSAAFQNPSLTTVRQPLWKMGEIAGEALLQLIDGDTDIESHITVRTELVVRDSTGPAPNGGAAATLARTQVSGGESHRPDSH